MNKHATTLFSVLSLLALGRLEAICDEASQQLTVTGRVSYLSFISSPLKEIYHAGPYYELTETIPFYKGLHAWMGIGYFQKTGHSLGSSSKTGIQLVPITLGPKFLYQVDRAVPYIGIGVRALYTHTTDDSPLVRKHIAKWGPGAVAEIGSLFLLTDHLFIDANGGYSYAKVRAPKPKFPNITTAPLTVEEWHVGLGIGYKF